MKENLKPTAENINKAKFKSTPYVISFDPFGETPMSKVVNEYKVKVAEKLDNDIFGVCIQLLKEEGITHEYVLNKEFIVNAVKKAIPAKPTDKIQIGVSSDGKRYEGKCPVCLEKVTQPKWGEKQSYCEKCGQKLDWSDTE